MAKAIHHLRSAAILVILGLAAAGGAAGGSYHDDQKLQTPHAVDAVSSGDMADGDHGRMTATGGVAERLVIGARPTPLSLEDCEVVRCGCAAGSSATEASGAPLTVTFHGVSTMMFDDGRDRILTDGYFTRPGFWRTLLLPVRSETGPVRDGLGELRPPLRAVLTAHAHHDHALDIVTIAREREEATIIGTQAVADLALTGGVSDQRVCAAAHGDTFAFGTFRIETLNVEHGSSPRLLRALLDRPLTDPPDSPAWFGRFKDNDNRSWLIRHEGLTVLVHPSAGLLPAPTAADVVFLGLGQVGKMEPDEATTYFSRTIGSPVRLIVPVHWDQFTTPPGEPLKPASWPFDDAEEGFRRLCLFLRDQPDVRVLKLEAGEQITLEPGRLERAGSGSEMLCRAS